MKKEDILPFSTTWMDSEHIMLSDTNRRKTNTAHCHLQVESTKNQTWQEPTTEYKLGITRDRRQWDKANSL